MGDRLLNKYRLVKMRPVLVEQLDYMDINRIIDKLYSEGILNEEKRKILYSTQETEKQHSRDLLEILERRVGFEDNEGKADIFDMFIKQLEDLEREDLVEKLKKCDRLDLQKICERREQSDLLNISEIRKRRNLAEVTENVSQTSATGLSQGHFSNPEMASVTELIENINILDDKYLENFEQHDALIMESKNDLGVATKSSKIKCPELTDICENVGAIRGAVPPEQFVRSPERRNSYVSISISIPKWDNRIVFVLLSIFSVIVITSVASKTWPSPLYFPWESKPIEISITEPANDVSVWEENSPGTSKRPDPLDIFGNIDVTPGAGSSEVIVSSPEEEFDDELKAKDIIKVIGRNVEKQVKGNLKDIERKIRHKLKRKKNRS